MSENSDQLFWSQKQSFLSLRSGSGLEFKPAFWNKLLLVPVCMSDGCSRFYFIYICMYLCILVFASCPLPFCPLLQAVLRPVRCCCHVVSQVLSGSKHEVHQWRRATVFTFVCPSLFLCGVCFFFYLWSCLNGSSRRGLCIHGGHGMASRLCLKEANMKIRTVLNTQTTHWWNWS